MHLATKRDFYASPILAPFMNFALQVWRREKNHAGQVGSAD
jgi:hypothetical protein